MEGLLTDKRQILQLLFSLCRLEYQQPIRSVFEIPVSNGLDSNLETSSVCQQY